MAWQKLGEIPGGTVLALAAAGPIGLAGTLAGLHRSEDSGQTWTQLRYGDAVQALAMTASEAGAAFAGCASGRLLGSVDGGRNWREREGWQFGTPTAIVLAPDFASTPHVFVATAEGVFRSLDGGETWQEANFGLLDTEVLYLAIAPDYAESELLWAGTANGGLYRSRNAGRAWRESGDGLHEGAISALAVSPNFAQDATLVAGLGDQGTGMFVSTDAGEIWRHVGCDDEINALVFSADGHQVFAATEDQLCSYDIKNDTCTTLADGEASVLAWRSAAELMIGNWTTGLAVFDMDRFEWTHMPLLSACVLPLVAAGETGLLALDSQGNIWGSREHGSDWDFLAWVPGAQHFVVEDKTTSAVVAARNLHVRSDEQWREIALLMLTEDDEARTAIALTPHEWFVGTKLGCVYHSTDGAETWQALPALAENASVLGIHASHSGRLYVLTATQSGERAFTAEVWWCALESAQPWQLLMALDGLSAPLAALQVCEGATADVVILVAQNNLVSLAMEAAREPQSVVLDSNAVVTALRASPNFAQDRTIFAATNEGVFQLHLGEDGWTVTAHDLADRPIVSLFEDEGRVGAAVLGGELWWCES